MGALSREAIRRIDAKLTEIYSFPKTDFANGYETACRSAKKMIQELEHLEPEIVRCKDCKHKPHTSDKYDYDNGDCGFEIIFPDYRCPCRCDDEYYNHIPDDDWYCGNAERRGEQDD